MHAGSWQFIKSASSLSPNLLTVPMQDDCLVLSCALLSILTCTYNDEYTYANWLYYRSKVSERSIIFENVCKTTLNDAKVFVFGFSNFLLHPMNIIITFILYIRYSYSARSIHFSAF